MAEWVSQARLDVLSSKNFQDIVTQRSGEKTGCSEGQRLDTRQSVDVVVHRSHVVGGLGAHHVLHTT